MEPNPRPPLPSNSKHMPIPPLSPSPPLYTSSPSGSEKEISMATHDPRSIPEASSYTSFQHSGKLPKFGEWNKTENDDTYFNKFGLERKDKGSTVAPPPPPTSPPQNSSSSSVSGEEILPRRTRTPVASMGGDKPHTTAERKDKDTVLVFSENATPKGTRKRHVKSYMTLYRAALRTNWEKDHDIFDGNEAAVTSDINNYGFTALHLAVSTNKGIDFVQKLLDQISSPDTLLNLRTSFEDYTVLHTAAVVGNIQASELLVEKNKMILYVKDKEGYLPIHRAVFNSQRETFEYLLKVTEDRTELSPFRGKMGVALLSSMIFAGYFEIALDLVTKYPDLATTEPDEDVDAPLMAIARKDDVFRSGMQYNILESLVYSCAPTTLANLSSPTKDQATQHRRQIYKVFYYLYDVLLWFYVMLWNIIGALVPHIKDIQDKKLNHHRALELVKIFCLKISDLDLRSYSPHYKNPIIQATRNDNYEVVQEIVDTFPHALWCTDEANYHIVQLAILHRCEKVYNLLVYQMSGHKHFHKTLRHSSNRNILHLVGLLPDFHKLNRIPGAALQMQRELQWFKEVEKFVNPKHTKELDDDNMTPAMLFTKEHEKLVKEGEQWLKKTADSYTITATLITTIVFAAAITVPGGNNQDTGKPIFSKEIAFIVFAISDAISLFASATSLLLFLSILTARFAEQDFLIRLPNRLMLGLATLFLSTTSMIVAFCATLFLMFGQQRGWTLVPVATLACLTITSFVTLQFPLLVDLFSSTYGRGIFGKQNNRSIF